jgi:hypothetical protein
VTELQPCGLPPCPEHHGLCAYHGDEPDRCPWCHADWTHIVGKVRSGTGRHSCERGRVWSKDEAEWRVATALKWREEAAAAPWGGDRSTHCPHRPQDIGRVRYAPLSRAERPLGLGNGLG